MSKGNQLPLRTTPEEAKAILWTIEQEAKARKLKHKQVLARKYAEERRMQG